MFQAPAALWMSSAVAAHRRAFGSDTVPGCYEDLDEADLIVLVGSNTAWCHPVLFRRMADAKERRGTKFVVIDPRRTQTAQECDLFLGIRPGTAARLDVHTQYGKVRNDLTATDGPAETDEQAEVRARTAFGDILIHRARTEA